MNPSMPAIQILVISLQRSVDRRNKVEQEMQKISMPWAFLDAVDGSSLTSIPSEYNPSKVKRLQGYSLTASEIGCYLSHKEAWKRCVSSSLPTLILEDDFLFKSNFVETLEILLNKVSKWDFVRLQGLYEVPFTKIYEVSGISLVKNHGDPCGTAAYILKPNVAKILIEHSVDIYEPVDHFLEHCHKHHAELLAIRPYPVDVTPLQTTIGDRPGRLPIHGFTKLKRSIFRAIDRWFSKNAWFPKKR